MAKNLLTLFCCLLSFSAFSQETILLKGMIIADSLEASSINIVNITQETGTTNTASGGFQIEVQENDVLLFSSLQYEIQEIKINSEIFQLKYLEVRLTEGINELDEVQISNISLTGNLEKDLSKIKTFNQSEIGFQLTSKPPPMPVERHLNTATGTPIVYALNLLNGEIKMLKKARKNEELEMLVERGINTFPVEFYTQLNIPEEEIKNFLHFCAENSELESLLSPGKRLELIEFYQSKATDFTENRMKR